MTYSSEILARAPLLFQKFDDASGTTAADASGNSRSGTYQNGVLLQQGSLLADNSGNSAYFDGANDNVLTPYGAWMNTSALTVVARIKPAAGALDAGSIAVVFSRWPNTASARSILLGISSTKKLMATVRLTTGAEVSVNGATTLVAGTTYTVAWRYNGSKVDVFVDGVLDGTLTPAAAVSTSTTAAAYFSAAEVVLSNADFYYQGQAQGLGWFGTALADADLLTIHQAATTNTTTTRLFTLDDPLPAIQSSLTLVTYTDTATGNRANGRLRNGGFVDESEDVIVPAPAGLNRGHLTTKAFAYPTPDLVDGRPT